MTTDEQFKIWCGDILQTFICMHETLTVQMSKEC
jgi:hypothetical protein